MDERFQLRIADLHCKCGKAHQAPNDGPLHQVHVHGKVELTIGGSVVDFGAADVCINDFTDMLIWMCDEGVRVHENHERPAIFRLYSRRGWPERPEMELNCMGHANRVIVRQKGEIAGWCLLVPGEFQQRCGHCLRETYAALSLRYAGEEPIPWEQFRVAGCKSFFMGSREREYGEPAITCERVVDFRVRPDNQSLEAACANCGASVWIRISQLKPEPPAIDWLLCPDCTNE